MQDGEDQMDAKLEKEWALKALDSEKNGLTMWVLDPHKFITTPEQRGSANERGTLYGVEFLGQHEGMCRFQVRLEGRQWGKCP